MVLYACKSLAVWGLIDRNKKCSLVKVPLRFACCMLWYSTSKGRCSSHSDQNFHSYPNCALSKVKCFPAFVVYCCFPKTFLECVLTTSLRDPARFSQRYSQVYRYRAQCVWEVPISVREQDTYNSFKHQLKR